jgi:hypothetical protein
MRPKRPLETILIKGRNLYRAVGGRTVRRRPWQEEALRRAVLGEKHERGAEARGEREERMVSPGGGFQGGEREVWMVSLGPGGAWRALRPWL